MPCRTRLWHQLCLEGKGPASFAGLSRDASRWGRTSKGQFFFIVWHWGLWDPFLTGIWGEFGFSPSPQCLPWSQDNLNQPTGEVRPDFLAMCWHSVLPGFPCAMTLAVLRPSHTKEHKFCLEPTFRTLPLLCKVLITTQKLWDRKKSGEVGGGSLWMPPLFQGSS